MGCHSLFQLLATRSIQQGSEDDHSSPHLCFDPLTGPNAHDEAAGYQSESALSLAKFGRARMLHALRIAAALEIHNSQTWCRRLHSRTSTRGRSIGSTRPSNNVGLAIEQPARISRYYSRFLLRSLDSAHCRHSPVLAMESASPTLSFCHPPGPERRLLLYPTSQLVIHGRIRRSRLSNQDRPQLKQRFSHAFPQILSPPPQHNDSLGLTTANGWPSTPSIARQQHSQLLAFNMRHFRSQRSTFRQPDCITRRPLSPTGPTTSSYKDPLPTR